MALTDYLRSTDEDDDEERQRRLLAAAGGVSAAPPANALDRAIAENPITKGGGPGDPGRLMRIANITGESRPETPSARTSEAAAPDLRLQPVDAAPPLGGDQPGLKPLGFRERQALPTASAGVPAGSAEWERNRLQRLQDQTANPYGSAENHPGFGGRLAHVLAKVGNIAGDIVDPKAMALIPGTELHRETDQAATLKRLGEAEGRETTAANVAGENRLRNVQGENLESEIKTREGKDDQSLVNDAQGNVTGWKDKSGALHSLDEPGTPQSIKDIADATANKQVPKFEKSDNGDIVSLKTDKNGKTSSEVVYKGDPKVESDLVHGHLVGGVPHTLLVNKKSGETIKDLGEEKMPSQEGAKEHAMEWVYGTDKAGKVQLVPKSDADAEGMTHIAKASDKDYNDAKTHTGVLNDMQAKLNDAVASRSALDQDSAQRAIIARELRSLDKYTTSGQLLDALVTSGASPKTIEYVTSIQSLRESSLGLPKEITGGSRVSEIQASALWSTLPSGASLNGDYALRQSAKFQANIDRLRERNPGVRGMHIEDVHPDITAAKQGGGGGQKSYTQKDVDDAAKQYGMKPEDVEAGFKAKKYTKAQ